MAFWLTFCRNTGTPDKTNLLLRATDGENGPNFNGQVYLAMCKENDHSDVRNLQINDLKTDADFVDGVSELKDANLNWYAENGYNVLIVDYTGNPIYYRMENEPEPEPTPDTNPPRDVPREPRNPRDERRDGGRRDNNRDDANLANISLRLSIGKIEAVRDASKKLTGYNVPVTASAFRSKKPVSDVRVDFYLAGDKQNDTPRKTVGDGNVKYVFRNVPPDPDGYTQLVARITDTDTEAAADAKVPTEEPEELLPTSVSAVPWGHELINDGKAMRHTVRILVRDQHKHALGNAEVRWACGEDKGTTITSNDPSQYGSVEINVEIPEEATEKFVATTGSVHSEQVELKGPKKKEAKIWSLTAKLSRPHPVRGWFIIEGLTLCNSKLTNCSVKATSLPTEVEVQAGVGTIVPNKGQSFDIVSVGGIFTFSARFTEAEADMVFQLADGTLATVPMVKPRI